MDPASIRSSVGRALAAVLGAAALAAAPAFASARAATDDSARAEVFVTQKLANGTRLSVLQVKAAPVQTFFAFLPLGLAYDDAGRTQWSHLLEHLLIRSTDPEGFDDGGVTFNGETTDGALRLDVHAPPKLAPQAAAKLCAWLHASEFDDEVLAREQKNVAAELANTAARGFTHKWATAAWCQAARHGVKEIELLGAVERATADEVAEYADAKLVLGSSVHVYAIGPLAPDEVRSLIETQLASGGGLASLANALGGSPRLGAEQPGSAGGAPKATQLATGELAATWDAPARHLLEWYVLPDATPADRAAASLLANALSMKLQSDATLGGARILALASADAVLPQGRVLFLSASLPDASAGTTASVAFRRAIEGLESVPPAGTLDAFVTMARNELAGPPDFAALRKQWKAQGARNPALNLDLVEAQIGLSLAAREWSSRLSFAQLGEAVRGMSAKELLARRDRDLAPGKASRLLLAPKE